jgi:hypothetical protein
MAGAYRLLKGEEREAVDWKFRQRAKELKEKRGGKLEIGQTVELAGAVKEIWASDPAKLATILDEYRAYKAQNPGQAAPSR